MKIQCDVCHKEVASLFCPSDEAALCHACDSSIHHANKLADKHKRFSLHHPTSKATTLCDICHEKRAYVFCREDRALLCRQCDVSVHGANEHTKTHDRFLLTGIKLGATTEERTITTSRNSKLTAQSSLSNQNIGSSRTVGVTCDSSSVPTSSISEYLIQTIPGYCMEDLLDASFASNACSKQSAFENEDDQLQSQFTSASNLYPEIDCLVGVMEMPKAKGGEEYSNWIHSYEYPPYKVPSITPPLVKRTKRSR
ncbi:hypothetical protein ACSQ67_022271 [Phaseolus vulgaris]